MIATTDGKLEATGRADERARWALDSVEFRQKTNDDGTLELAAPLATSPADPHRAPILWLGYSSQPQEVPVTP